MEREEVISILKGLIDTAVKGRGFENQGPPPDQANLSALQELKTALIAGKGDIKTTLEEHRDALQTTYKNLEDGTFVISRESADIDKGRIEAINRSFGLKLDVGKHTKGLEEKGGEDKGLSI